MISFTRLLTLACAFVLVNASGPVSDGVYEAPAAGKKRSPEPHFLERRVPGPSGYTRVFGPLAAANNGPVGTYMGYTALTSLDFNACATACNTRGADPNGGVCKYFNIWEGVQPGKANTFTCSMYTIPLDSSSATNTGQGTLKVTNSYGYARTSLLPDGGFEEYACAGGGTFCYTTSDANWVGTSALDATIIDYIPYAHTGHSSALLGSGTGADTNPGTLTAVHPLSTVHGATYQISFFQQSTYSGASGEAASFIDVKWNGATVLSITPGYQAWTLYTVTVTGTGSDHLSFFGGKAPAWSFIDDVYVFAM